MTFCANSMCILLSGGSQTHLQKNSTVKVDFEDPAQACDVDAPNSATATIAPGTCKRSEHSQAKAEHMNGHAWWCPTVSLDYTHLLL